MNKGFTLVELLVIISILAILASISLVVYTGILATSRDARRVSDINVLANALQIYYSAHGVYPIIDSWIKIEEDFDSSGLLYQALNNSFVQQPRDPSYPKVEDDKIYSYQYRSTSDGASYKLHTERETSSPIEHSSGPDAGSISYVVGEDNWSCGDNLTDTRDNKVYTTALIGTQCWMAKNLNVGTRINGSTDQTDNDIIEKYCFSDLETNCTSLGGMYTWSESLQYATSCNGNGASQPACTNPAQGVCPMSWHLPSHYEFVALERAVCTSGTCATNFPYNTTTVGWRGTNEGTKLKTGGSANFNALLAGYVLYNSFQFLDVYGSFWTSTEGSDNWLAWDRTLSNSNSTINGDHAPDGRNARG